MSASCLRQLPEIQLSEQPITTGWAGAALRISQFADASFDLLFISGRKGEPIAVILPHDVLGHTWLGFPDHSRLTFWTFHAPRRPVCRCRVLLYGVSRATIDLLAKLALIRG